MAEAETPRLGYFAPEQISKNLSMTPEGFLLCSGVPIARIGPQLYGEEEIDLKGDSDGRVIVDREPDEVFAPETIASANGKTVTNDHPPDGLLFPDNWKEHTVGDVLNPRRGEGIEDDLLLADLMVKDKAAIADVLAGKKEVSAGYDAQYEQTGPGRGRQHRIMINHVALVDHGRCGPRCAIQDHAPRTLFTEGDRAMTDATMDTASLPKTRIGRFMARVMRATKDADTEELQRLAEEAKEKDKEGTGDAGELHFHLPGAGGEGGGEADPEKKPAAEADKTTIDDPVAAIAADVAEIKDMIADIADIEQEEVDLQSEQESDPERDYTDRRMGLRDRRRGMLDKMKSFRRKGSRDDANIAAQAGTVEAGAKVEGSGPGNDRITSEDPTKLGTGDRRRGTTDALATMDSAGLKDEFQSVIAKAELLCPGIRIPTFDAKVTARVTADRLCAFRRRTLDSAYHTTAGKAALDEVTGDTVFNLGTATCDAVGRLFNASSAVIAAQNRSLIGGGSSAAGHSATGDAEVSMVERIRQRNEANRKRFHVNGAA